eukprot:gene9000-biopygen3384
MCRSRGRWGDGASGVADAPTSGTSVSDAVSDDTVIVNNGDENIDDDKNDDVENDYDNNADDTYADGINI